MMHFPRPGSTPHIANSQVYCHRFDPTTPLEETVRAMSWVVDKGIALYWGTSEWSSQEIQQAVTIANRLGLHAPVMEQPLYNLFARDRVEREYKAVNPQESSLKNLEEFSVEEFRLVLGHLGTTTTRRTSTVCTALLEQNFSSFSTLDITDD